ncbi:MAG: class I SAM-dependent methyltransferase [Oscillatoria sp. SIO1A7]|nr:class I SAM-dependent methyltransferase [Oscillatoria sp. SIO1A7]
MDSFFSAPGLKLVKLNELEYMEALIAYRSQYKNAEMMLEATIRAIEKNMPSQESFSILSIGCGSGIFEKPFVNKLLESKKTISFVGIDPNQEECTAIEEWCQEIRRSQPSKFDFAIHPVGFDRFQSSQTFDIILLIHSLYYFPDIEPLISKSYQLLKQGGMEIVAITPRTLINEPYELVCQRLLGRSPWSSEDLWEVLAKSGCNIPFCQETIEFSVNITECFHKESQLGKQLLNCLIGVNTNYFSPLQLQLLLDYFKTIAQKTEGGEIVVPHCVDLFYFDKTDATNEAASP